MPGTSSLSPAFSRVLPTVKLINQQRLSVSELVDSGDEQSLIGKELFDCLSIPTQRLQTPLTVTGITGQVLTQIQLKTLDSHLIISGNHHERSEFFVFDSPVTQLILGFPW